MSSNGHLGKTDLQLAEQYFNEASYLKAILYYEKALQSDPTNPEIYLKKGQTQYETTNFTSALQDANQGLLLIEEKFRNKTQSSLNLEIQLLNLRIKTYQSINDFDSAKKDEERLKILVQQQKKLTQVIANDSGMLSNETTTENREYYSARDDGEIPDREQEVQTVYDLIQKAMEQQMLSTEFNIVHIVSMKWFEKWKNYTNFSFERMQKPKDEQDQNNSDSGEKLLNESHKAPHPGPINSDDILDLEGNFLQDPDSIKEYCNLVLQTGLVENKDFIILPNNVWKYLVSIYSGKDIKRYVVCINDETGQTSIEIWLKKINFLICPPIKKDQGYHQCEVHSLYISKMETVKDLREKITRIFKAQGNIDPNVNLSFGRLWKLDPREDCAQFLRGVAEDNSGEAIPFNGKRLADGLVLEEAELGDTDTVVCEYKTNGAWRFMTEEEHTNLVMTRCANCGKRGNNLPFCECKLIKYCDAACQKNHRPVHKEKCIQAKYAISKNTEIMKQFKLSQSKFGGDSRYGICGLQNLGNTCFMNSSLQCLSHVTELTYYFLENHFIKDLNKHNRLGTGGRLAANYAELMKELWHGSDSYVSPWDIKKIISEVASQFSGYNQQDAAEFLSYLVDGIHEDLNKIVNKPYIETIESDNRPDDVVAKQSWENHLKRNQSLIIDLMYGQFKSKLVCPDCGKVSITFDPYLSLTLPIPTVSLIEITVYFVHKANTTLPGKLNLSLDPMAPALSVIEKVSEVLSLPKETLEMVLIKDQVFDFEPLNKMDIKTMKSRPGIPFVFETYNKELDGPVKEFVEQERVQVEVQIFQDMEDEQIAFSRMIEVPKKASLKELHLQVYAKIKGNMSFAFPNKQEQEEDFYIDEEDHSRKAVEQEYELLVGQKKHDKHNFVYELAYLHQSKSGKEEVILIPYEEAQTLEKVFPQVDILPLRVIFNKNVDCDKMKLNRCTEMNVTNSTAINKKSYTLYDCFDLFASPEILDQDNLWYCNKCKDHKQATKKMDVYKLPKILILHLKRFKTSRVHSIGSYYFSGGSSKITSFVDFPLEGLDLSKYTLEKTEEPQIYDLFAVTNHYGSLGGGHYTAYAKNPEKKIWLDFNDSSVSRQNPDEVASSAAYLLFYRKRETEKPTGGNGSSKI